MKNIYNVFGSVKVVLDQVRISKVDDNSNKYN